MGKADYSSELQSLAGAEEWERYLRTHSGLPGPRGNLELAHAFAKVAPAEMAWRFAAIDNAAAPTNTTGEFVAFCGVLALGPQAARGDETAADVLRARAGDARWRVREAAATALQLWGDADIVAMVAQAQRWARGNRLEQRAAVAAVAEPRLLKQAEVAAAALALVDEVTATIAGAPDARREPFRVLRQALGYAWSVVIVASPAAGKSRFEPLVRVADAHIGWIVHENLKKARLGRMDAAWVAKMRCVLSEAQESHA